MDLTYSSRPENLLDTLGSNLENSVIEIITSQEFIRECLTDLPCCERPSLITLVNIKSRALKKIKQLFENGLRGVDTDFNPEDISSHRVNPS